MEPFIPKTTKHSYKDILMTRNVVPIIMVFLLLMMAVKTCNDKVSEIEELRLSHSQSTQAILNEYKDSRDELGRQIVEYKQRVSTIEVMLSEKSKEAEELRRELKKPKNTQSYLKFNSITSGSISTPIRDTFHLKDTLFLSNNYPAGDSLKHFSYRDTWLHAEGLIGKDSIHFRYGIKNSFKHITYWDKPGIFKAPELKVKMISENPNTQIDSVYSFTVPPKKNEKLKKTIPYILIGGLITGLIISNR